MAAARRFYKAVTVGGGKGAFTILLDGKPLHTPAKSLLALPAENAALAILSEWQAQGDKINPAAMPFTRLANTAIDRVAPDRTATIAEITRYGASDLLCYRAENPDELVRRQAAAWDPLLHWLAATQDIHLKSTTGVIFLPQNPEYLAKFDEIVGGFDNFSLAGLHNVTAVAGSLVIGLAVAAGHMTAAEAAALSTLDESYQAERWGEDAEARERLQGRAQELAEAAQFLEFFRGFK